MKRLATVFLVAILFMNACAPVAQVVPVPVIEEATGTPSPAPTVVFTAISMKTVTAAPSPTMTPAPTNTPTITPTLDPIRDTPPTLMLHRPNLQFDSLYFLKQFIVILKYNNMHVVTYRHIHEHPEITATEKGRLFVITIDDIYLAYPMDYRVVEMIRILREADYPAVLGVVTETERADPKTAAFLTGLANSGWEIATHTDNHVNLGRAEEASSRLVYNEVTVSMDKIEKVTGIRPITLVLPEGQMVYNVKPIQQMGIYWIVGISDGNTYDSRDKIIYVGREGPYKNAGETYKLMRQRFGFK